MFFTGSSKPWILSLIVAVLSIWFALYTWNDWDHSRIVSPIHALLNRNASSSAQSQAGSNSERNTITIPTNCTSPPSPPHSCTFYAACLEPHFHCGPNGYPLGFGEKFCTKFSLPSNVGRLSEKAQDWMWKTMGCLQKALVPELTVPAPAVQPSSSDGGSDTITNPDAESDSDSEEACKALEDKAFSTHAPCYLSSGLCSLSPEDWVEIVDIIGVETLLKTWDAFEGGVEAGEGCLDFFARAVGKKL